MKFLLEIGTGLLAAALGVGAFQAAPAPKTIWDSVYTKDQAKRGEDLYTKTCVSCHGDELEGRAQIPTLVGDVFLQKWDGQPLDNLFEKMQTTMPATHPGGLERSQSADLLAYILSQNNLPAGSTELTNDHDQLLKIQFTAKK